MRATRRFRARGVTILELMMVVLIIGIFAALAAPAVANGFRDSRALDTAHTMTSYFNKARFTAGATGAAHLVRIRMPAAPTLTGTATIELRAARVAATGVFSTQCPTTKWTAADSTQLSITNFRGGGHPSISISAQAGTRAVIDYCITPSGVVWLQAAGAWSRPTGTRRLAYEVVRYDDAGLIIGIRRTVTVGANGVPSIVGS